MIRIWRGQHDGDGVARLTSRLQPLIGLQRERERERERGGGEGERGAQVVGRSESASASVVMPRYRAMPDPTMHGG